MAQPGSALAWGASGRRFKSGRPDQFKRVIKVARQLKNKDFAPVKKIWLNSYPKNVPAEINPDAHQSLKEIFEQTCAQYPDHPAFYNLGVTLTFKQTEFYARAFAAYLQQVLKLKKGSRIAIMMPNVLQYPIVVFGAFLAGLIVVNVNPLYTAPELIYELKDSGADAIVVLSNFAHTVEEALPDVLVKHVIITDIGDLFPRLKAWLIHFVLKYVKKQIKPFHIPHAIPFRQVIAEGKKLSLNPVELNGQDIAFLQYTGGTTGVAKGAMLTHRNLLANVEQAEAWLGTGGGMGRGKEIAITALPLYHIFSLTANLLFMSKMGGLNVLIINPRDVPSLISELKKFKFTMLAGVNTLFNALLKNPKLTQVDFSEMKLALGGGMAIQRAVAEKWHAVTGKPLLEAYGLTEASPAVTINPLDLREYNGTIGLPLPSTDVCVLDEQHKEVPIGQPGELAIKGPQVMRGYWQRPGETQKVFTKDGWLLTGDIVSIDEHGFVRLLERKKDMILVSGFNVYPNEVEDILVRMPGVVEAAVIGVPDENSGEAVKAFLVVDSSNMTAQDVQQFARKNLTGYKIPKHVEFVKSLPKSNVGKVLRRALRTAS